MLLLTRKKGEAIFIGKNISVRIMDVSRGQVKIGIQAPKDINVVRDELLRRKPPQLRLCNSEG